MTIMVVLFAVLMSALNTAVTGNGNVKAATVHGVEDQMKLDAIVKGLMVSGDQLDMRWFEPANVKGGPGIPANVTSVLYSALIMGNFITPELVISANEMSPNVSIMEKFNYGAYDVTNGKFWDPKFKADLETGSNASFAHMPLYGKRKTYWTEGKMDSFFPMLGTRGPKDGNMKERSYTFGRDGTWAGFRAYGDGHVAYTTSFFAEGRGLPNGSPDNVFAIEGDVGGDDAILAFTKMMSRDGPTLQFD
ncbi:MAG: hypothetical protein U0572_17140 [Phycisphaerales bacterium]